MSTSNDGEDDGSEDEHNESVRNESVLTSTAPTITFHPAKHKAVPFPSKPEWKNKAPAIRILQASCRDASQLQQIGEIFQSSLHQNPSNFAADRDIILDRNGFVNTVIEAYNHHRALVIRPDDVRIIYLYSALLTFLLE